MNQVTSGRSVVIFGDPSPLYKALAQVCRKLGIPEVRREYELILHPQKCWTAPYGPDKATTSLALVVKMGQAPIQTLAHATRLRCDPVRFQGPICVVSAKAFPKLVPIESLDVLGIKLLQTSHLITKICLLSHSLDRWQTYPGLDCRPAWAIKAEAKLSDHRTTNAFRWIGDHGNEFVKQWMIDAKSILLPD
jgi:hypothetical protein